MLAAAFGGFVGGVLGAFIAFVITALIVFLYALIRAPYEQRNALRARLVETDEWRDHLAAFYKQGVSLRRTVDTHDEKSEMTAIVAWRDDVAARIAQNGGPADATIFLDTSNLPGDETDILQSRRLAWVRGLLERYLSNLINLMKQYP